MVAGYVWVWVVSGFLGKWGGERERKKTFKIFFFPASACVGKKENNAFKVFWFFFFSKNKM